MISPIIVLHFGQLFSSRIGYFSRGIWFWNFILQVLHRKFQTTWTLIYSLFQNKPTNIYFFLFWFCAQKFSHYMPKKELWHNFSFNQLQNFGKPLICSAKYRNTREIEIKNNKYLFDYKIYRDMLIFLFKGVPYKNCAPNKIKVVDNTLHNLPCRIISHNVIKSLWMKGDRLTMLQKYCTHGIITSIGLYLEWMSQIW